MDDLKENNYYLARMLSMKEKQLKTFKRKEMERGLSKNKLKYKLQHCGNSLDQLDNSITCVRSFTIEFLDDCSAMVQKLRNEMGEILQMFDDIPCNETLKTQTVRPMVAGLPLKRAMITLKRLNPHHLQQRDTNIQPNGHYERANFQLGHVVEENTHRRRSFSQQRRHHPKQINSEQRRRSSSHSASIHSQRCGVSHEVPVRSSQTNSGVPLKEASIHLKRLDSRLVSLPSAPDDAEVESSEEAPVASVDNGGREADTSAPVDDRRPMVVLERMERYEYFAGTCNNEDSTPIVESAHNVCENCQAPQEESTSSEVNTNREEENTVFPVNVKQEVPACDASQTNDTNIAVCVEDSKKPLVSLIDISRSFKSFTVNMKKNKKRKVNQKAKVQKKEEKSKNQMEKPHNSDLENQVPLSETPQVAPVPHSQPEEDPPEDPLEGPSWLYSETTTPSAVRAFKRKKPKCVVPYVESSDESISDEPPMKRKIAKKKKKSKFQKKSTGNNAQDTGPWLFC